MKIAMIGAGNVGGTLGKRFSEQGHDVVYGVPDPSKHANLNALAVPDAVKRADVVLLAAPWSAAKDAIDSAGDLSGKILIDATNPIKATFDGMIDGASAAEQISHWAKGARVVKAFNTVGFGIMANPLFADGAASMLVAGDDGDAKKIAMQLAKDIGFEPVDAGPLEQAKYLEDFAWLWISMAVKYGQGREMAFHLMKR